MNNVALLWAPPTKHGPRQCVNHKVAYHAQTRVACECGPRDLREANCARCWNVGSEILTFVAIQSALFWHATQCNLEKGFGVSEAQNTSIFGTEI
jgi:hypothetical protein